MMSVASVQWKYYITEYIPFQFHIQRCYTGVLKSDAVGIFVPWKLANATNQEFLYPHSWLSIYLQHNSPMRLVHFHSTDEKVRFKGVK